MEDIESGQSDLLKTYPKWPGILGTGVIDITLNNRFHKGELVNIDPTKKVKPMMIHMASDNEFEPIQPTLNASQDELARNPELKNTCKRMLYENQYGYKEGQGYKYDKIDEPEHGLFHFYSNETKLKQTNGQKAEKLQMLVSVTMYNEDYEALSKTLIGIHDNLQEFKHQFPAWKDWNMVVVVFQDGIMKMNGSRPFPPTKKQDKPPDENEIQEKKMLETLYIGDVEKLIDNVNEVRKTWNNIENRKKKLNGEQTQDKSNTEPQKEESSNEQQKQEEPEDTTLTWMETKIDKKLQEDYQKSIEYLRRVKETGDYSTSDPTIGTANPSQIDKIIAHKLHLQKQEHPLKDRQAMIMQEGEYFVKEGIAMPGNWPTSLPKNTSQLYQTIISYEDYLQSEDDMKTFKTFDQQWKRQRETTMNVFFLLKHFNNKKLSSQMWLFQGFCQQFEPKYMTLVDVGTIPHCRGIVNYFRSMEEDPNLGGVCGFMGLYYAKRDDEDDHNKISDTNMGMRCKCDSRLDQDKDLNLYQKHLLQGNSHGGDYGCNGFMAVISFPEKVWNSFAYWLFFIFHKLHLFFDVRVAQNYEYTVAHILDKNFESSTGFLHVLPGAWSGYRREALFQSKLFSENLIEKKYLKTVLNPDKQLQNLQEMNVYLAEDRILSLGIVCQEDKTYKLKYVPDAYAETDAVMNFMEFIRQRRRWINSTWFALDYVLNSYDHYLEASRHGLFYAKIAMPFNMFMAALGKYNAYFLLCFYFVAYLESSQQGLDPFIWREIEINKNSSYSIIPLILPMIYVSLVFLIYLVSSTINTGTPKGPFGRRNQQAFYALSGFMGFFQVAMYLFIGITLFMKYFSESYEALLREKQQYEFDKLLEKNSNFKQNLTLVFTSAGGFNADQRNEVLGYILLGLVGLNVLFVPILAFIHYLTTSMPNHKSIIQTVLLTFFPTFIYYTGAYTHTLLIYSFCNIDDVSWGTKGSTDSEGGHGTSGKSPRQTKIEFVEKWLISNILLVFILIILNKFLPDGVFIIALACYGSLPVLIKFILAIVNHISYFGPRLCQGLEKNKKISQNLSLVNDAQKGYNDEIIN